MDIAVTIESVDKTSLIEWLTFSIEDNINDQPNLCKFRIKKHSGQTYKPDVNDEVIVTDGATKIFAGKIKQIQETQAAKILYYNITCKDYTDDLDRILVTERYENMTVNDIIDDINTNYLAGMGITIVNVDCAITVGTISFNNLSVSKCLQLLAQQTNYSWYIDYDKDIHFFAKNTELAPFNLNDAGGYHIFDSLQIKEDITQLRNVIIVRGGEKISDSPRSKYHTGDGSQTTFNTDLQFAETPVVTVGGVPKTVGNEFLDNDADFDCLWSYQQKYIRFVAAPAAAAAIEFNAKYKIPIYVYEEDPASIAQYGRYELYKEDKGIKSSDEAVQLADAQLEAYAGDVREGSFRTYTSGLVSGQTININLTDRGIDEDFLIQRVSLKMRSYNSGEWTAELATLRTIGIINFLQSLLLTNAKTIEVNEDQILEKYAHDYQSVQVTEEIALVTPKQDYQNAQVTEDIQKDPFGAGVAPTFVLAPYTPSGQTDEKRTGRLNISMYVY
jgi:hypothetical protein